MRIKISGVEAKVAKLRAATTTLKPEIRQAAIDSVNLMSDRAGIYPPQQPGNKYPRTGRFGAGWTDTPVVVVDGPGLGLIATKTNPTPYGPYLQGDQQRPFNAAWGRVKDIANDPSIKDAITGLFLLQLNKLIK